MAHNFVVYKFRFDRFGFMDGVIISCCHTEGAAYVRVRSAVTPLKEHLFLSLPGLTLYKLVPNPAICCFSLL